MNPNHPARRPVLQPLVLAMAVAAGGLLAAGTAGAWSLTPSWLGGDKSTTVATNTVNTGANTSTGNAPPPVPPLSGNQVPNFRAIVAQSAPAVVGVTVEGMHHTEAQQGGPSADDPFYQFFKGLPGFQGQIPGHQVNPGAVPFRGQGSGFIIGSDGLILTNAHVVREAKEVTVKLNDRREFSAKVLGVDPATDIAVLRIKATGLPTVRLGDVRNIEVGDPVLAIGTPFGFEETATRGIVSAKGRSLPGENYVPFIQTDAAVNPGNSGGPLIDGTGAVVGINAQIYSSSGGYEGLSFAIPINVALAVKDQILATGHVAHARLGVTIQDLTQPLANSFGLARPDGALVASVAPDSPAAGAGLKEGDVITEVNGDPVIGSGALSSRIGLSAPGQTVKLKVWRDGSAHDLSIKLARADDDEDSTTVASESGGQGKLGLSMRPLTRDERSQAHVDHGLVIENAVGPAAHAGIESGDVLLSINGKPVSSLDQVRSLMGSHPKSVALLVDRDGNRIFVPVNLSEG
jgi:serine protease Do